MLLAGLLVILAIPAACWAVAGSKHPSLCKVRHPSDSRIEWNCLRLKKGESVETRFGERWRDVLRFNRVDRRHVYPGVPLKGPRRLEDVEDFTPMPAEYPEGDNEAKLVLLDLEEQFLGAYEYGKRVFSAPIASGEVDNETPEGEFRVTAYHSAHRSTEYFIEDTDILYPMTWALRFHVDRDGVAYWIHGRDMPGYPASHGCVGLYDEMMQKSYYRVPVAPEMEDARKLFEWAIAPLADDGKFHLLKGGPVVRIVGGTREKKPRETIQGVH